MNQHPLPPGPIQIDDADQASRWLEHFGITTEQLREAVDAVGNDPQAVTEHLLQQGASAGAG